MLYVSSLDELSSPDQTLLFKGVAPAVSQASQRQTKRIAICLVRGMLLRIVVVFTVSSFTNSLGMTARASVWVRAPNGNVESFFQYKHRGIFAKYHILYQPSPVRWLGLYGEFTVHHPSRRIHKIGGSAPCLLPRIALTMFLLWDRGLVTPEYPQVADWLRFTRGDGYVFHHISQARKFYY